MVKFVKSKEQLSVSVTKEGEEKSRTAERSGTPITPAAWKAYTEGWLVQDSTGLHREILSPRKTVTFISKIG